MSNVGHLSTGCVSAQYHLVSDDFFEIVFSAGNDSLLDDIYNFLFDSDQNYYPYDVKFISNDPLVYHPPPIDEVWLSGHLHYACSCNIDKLCFLVKGSEQVKWIDETPDDLSDPFSVLIEQSYSNSETLDLPPPVFVPEGGFDAAQPNEDDASIITPNTPEGTPPNIPLLSCCLR